jgi:1-acyl-sn-glycerol-3-phosphate acyltransferase
VRSAEAAGAGPPRLGPEAPRSGGLAARALGGLVLRVAGWRLEGSSPNRAQCVLLVAPHTSNWDFVIGLAAKWALGLRVRFVGKHTLFRFPLGVLMRAVGGIPVDRRAPEGYVEKAAAFFTGGAPLYLVIAPEGTRRRVLRWKTGFHRIAMSAGVPILPVALDYSVRAVRLLPFYEPTGDFRQDLAALSALFRPEMACHPENYAVPAP